MPLEYEAGRVLFRGEQRMRSSTGMLLLAAGSVFLVIGVLLPVEGDTVGRILKLGFGGFGLVAATAALIGIASDQRNVFEIRTDGIQDRRRFVPWTKVKRLMAAGRPAAARVHFVYIGTGAMGVYRHLPSDERLTPATYEMLIEEIRRCVGGTYPHLELGGYVASD